MPAALRVIEARRVGAIRNHHRDRGVELPPLRSRR